MIIPCLSIDTQTNGYTPRNKDLASCLLVSKTFYEMTLSTLYKRVMFPHSTIYSKFLSHIAKYPGLGKLVRGLDFSQFTSVGLGRTKKMQSEIQKLTSTTLLHCLELTPSVREFLASEALDEDVDSRVLQKLFCDMPQLQAVDFCASTASTFVQGLTQVMSLNNDRLKTTFSLSRVGLHGCNTLPTSVFTVLMPRLANVTHLDLTHTQLTDESLMSLPHTAKLTHLSLSKCNKLHGGVVVDFLLNHPAVQELVYLNLHFDTSRYRLLSASDMDELLPKLPNTLRSLNLNGAKINSTHTPHLRRLAGFLEELSLGSADLSVDDVNQLFAKSSDGDHPDGHKSTLHYLCLTGVNSMTPNTVIFPDTCVLLHPDSYPLEVIEFGEKVLEGLKAKVLSGKKYGWVVKSQARRGWYVRNGPGELPGGQKYADALSKEDGSRPWKMGGKWWGSRKVNLAHSEIGGLYGYYAFGY